MGLLALAGTACEPNEAAPAAAANPIETPVPGSPSPMLGPVTVEEVAGLLKLGPSRSSRSSAFGSASPSGTR